MTANSDILTPVIMKVSPSDRLPRGKEQVQMLSRLARQAAQMSSEKSGHKITAFCKNQDGVPIPTAGVYWSISHKPHFVGGVVAAEPVGIDIEQVRQVDVGVMQRIADDQEWALAGGRELEAFFRFWTAKEAVLKAMGVGFTGLSNCRILRMLDKDRLKVGYDQKTFVVHQIWFAEDHLAAVTETGRSLQWTLV